MTSSQTKSAPAHDDTSQAATTSAPSPIPALKQRQSSIKFSNNTNTISRSPMSRVWRDQDEITPIRTADGAPGRTYNTADSDETLPSTKKKQKKSSANSSEDDQDEDKSGGLSWYKRVVDKYGSVSLENKGSVARDHLALERTFLAWLRTSLAFASIGIAVTQLFRLNTTIARKSQSYQSPVPFSPYMGKSIPVELLPYLQQGIATAAASMPTLGPTLLDQLLLLPSPGDVTPALPDSSPYHGSDFDEHAAQRLRHVGKPLGATFLAISIVILFIGFHRYFESQHWIIRGKFPASRGSIFLVAFIAGALIVASLVVVLVVAPTSFEKKG